MKTDIEQGSVRLCTCIVQGFLVYWNRSWPKAARKDSACPFSSFFSKPAWRNWQTR